MKRQKEMTDDVIVVVVVVVSFWEMKLSSVYLQWHHDLYVVDREEAALTMDGTFEPTS